MAEYERFKTQFIEQFQDYLPVAYRDWTVEIQEIPKVNGYREAVTLCCRNGEGGSPVLYFDELYAFYRESEDMTKVLQKAAAFFVLGMDHIAKVNPEMTSTISKETIIFCLVSAKENLELLRTVPHRRTMDLALLYRIMVPTEDGGFDSAIITTDLAEEAGVTEEELYQLAVENTPRLLPLEVLESEDAFFIVTNEKRTLGAVAVMYPDVLEQLAEKMESDLFILPASIHEVFVVPDIGQDVDDLNRVVGEANRYLLRRDEYLSSHVYYYQRDCNKVFIPEGKVVN